MCGYKHAYACMSIFISSCTCSWHGIRLYMHSIQMCLDLIIIKNIYRLMHTNMHVCMIDMYTVFPSLTLAMKSYWGMNLLNANTDLYMSLPSVSSFHCPHILSHFDIDLCWTSNLYHRCSLWCVQKLSHQLLCWHWLDLADCRSQQLSNISVNIY